jgi:hypothetical protein
MLIHARTRQIFGKSRWGRPSRFLSDIPDEVVVHRATRGATTDSMRYFDTPARSAPRPGAFRDGEIMHPQAADHVEDEEVFSLRGAPPSSLEREVGGRYVDPEFFSDDAPALRRGARVKHDVFGEGVVRRVLESVDPAVVAYFPARGEKKVLVRFLRITS